MKEKLDYIIVGQGLAGTWLSWFLLSKGQRVLVVDRIRPKAASHISSGIINPITGHKHIKTWKIDQLLPFSRQHYQQMQNLLGTDFCYDRAIIWNLLKVEHLNNMHGRSATRGYEQYIDKVTSNAFSDKLVNSVGHAVVQGAFQVNTKKFVSAYREYLQEKGALLEEDFLYKDLDLGNAMVTWKNYEAKKVLFCEGYYGLQNPYFKPLVYVPAKGEFLVVKIPSLQLKNAIIKGKVLIVPLEEDTYWVGATYSWDPLDEETTMGHRKQLIDKLEKTITVPYEIISQHAGIRPSTKRRRPFVGLHPEYAQIGIFNGLGTKGVALSCYFAAQFCDHLLEGKALDWEVEIAQFWVE